MNNRSAWLVLGVVLVAAGCTSGPKVADWQLEARSAMERSVSAYLEGNSRVEQAELTRARSFLAKTGRPDLLAQAELLHCASHVASLVTGPCLGFERLRQDATPPQRAYADYLQGRHKLQDTALLPESQRAVAAGNTAALAAMADPLSRLVAAGVLFLHGNATEAAVATAVLTASSQGWQRPLSGWLKVQLRQAEQAGRIDEAARIARRLVLSEASGTQPSAAPATATMAP